MSNLRDKVGLAAYERTEKTGNSILRSALDVIAEDEGVREELAQRLLDFDRIADGTAPVQLDAVLIPAHYRAMADAIQAMFKRDYE